ncbi:hypothetical protein NQ317_002612 [Molorchus minor]|uniref:BED-type domain-containing protein n=1 Tax=Molorchus minor TaxID=1323400 RepID=A0ABQ9JUI8_9CUCU|nr:hypothetical protein NQ317_002612 [Molorchus minor]
MALRKPSIKISGVWNFFSIKSNSERIAVCNMCNTELSFKSTSFNLKKHIERKHPLVNLRLNEPQDNQTKLRKNYDTFTNEQEVAPVPSTSASSIQTSESIESNIPCLPTKSTVARSKVQSTVKTFLRRKLDTTANKKINDTLMLLFIHDYQPFTVVEDYGFKKFVGALNPSYQLPSRKTITNSILPALYDEAYNAMTRELSEVQSVTLTTDCWTSRNGENFLAVTVHFLNADFELQSRVLDCTSCNIQHTSKNLAEELRKIIQEWGIENKIIMFISDNAANIKKGCKR